MSFSLSRTGYQLTPDEEFFVFTYYDTTPHSPADRKRFQRLLLKYNSFLLLFTCGSIIADWERAAKRRAKYNVTKGT